jgi:putative endonuclease
MGYYVYVIKSEIDGRLYKGMSQDPPSRLIQHNAGKVRSTKGVSSMENGIQGGL